MTTRAPETKTRATARQPAPRRVRGRSGLTARTVGALALVACLLTAAGAAAPAGAGGAARSATHFACSRRDSPRVPCYFSTPAGNIRCKWTPSSKAVKCELLSTGRGYILYPSGRARAIRPHLTRRGETLPTNQQIEFPHKLSCHDTRTTMTCNQDEGTGFFRLSPHGSRSAAA